MKKLFIALAIAAGFVSCQKENNLETEADLSYELANDFSSTGIYKGVLTTLDDQTRATFEIIIPDASRNEFKNSKPKAIVTFEDNTVRVLSAANPQEARTGIENLTFSNEDMSFKFSVEATGTNPAITNLVIDNNEAAALVAKNTNRAPVTPLMGSFGCTTCGTHPTFDTDITKTFNNLIITPANGNPATITTQVTFNGTSLSGSGTQDNCGVDPTDSNLDLCNIQGSINLSNGDVISWSGTHTYNNEATSNGNDCSDVAGNWTWISTNYGNLSGWFNSGASTCDPPVEIYFNNFNDFRGTGFEPNTTDPEKLDSDVIIVTGLSDGDLAYGDTETTGDFAKGQSTGNVSGGGVWAFRITGGNRTIGIQPTGGDWTPGTFEFKIPNNTGLDFTQARISYKLWVNNNGPRSSTYNCSYSTDGITFTPITQFEYTSPETEDTNGFIENNFFRQVPATVNDGDFIYLRFSGADESGSGIRDEFGLDNVKVQLTN